MLVLIGLIAIANLATGYAVAKAFGFGPPGWTETWWAMTGRIAAASRGAAPDCLPNGPPPTAQSLAAMMDFETDSDAGIEPFAEAYDDDAADVIALLGPANPEVWDVSEKYVETSILRLNVAMMKSGARATAIDTRLRECRGQSDRETIQDCLRLLREDCEAYLAEQGAASEKFRERIDELGELKSLGEDIEMTNLEQAAQIETTLSNLQHMDFDDDLETANQRLLHEIHLLRVARHRLRDSQEVAFLTIARYEKRLDKIERQLFIDPLTRLRNRIGFETTLWDWWQDSRQRGRQMSVALFDVDGMTKFNELHGSALADKLIYQLAQLVHGQAGSADLVARFAGQQFIVVIRDVGPRTAIRNAEMVRQTIEKTTFQSGGQEIQMTVSTGVTEIAANDSYEQFVARIEAALKLAKQSGGNRACAHTGRDVEPIESPNLGAQPREIDL